MTSPSDGSPNTVFAAMFLRARMTSPSDGPLFTSGIYTTRTLSASQYPLLLSPVPSMEVITSNKGGQKLCLDGFMYIKQWQRRNIRWRCAQRSKFGCKGALGTTLDLQNPHVLHDHNHNPDPHSTAAAKCHVQMVQQKKIACIIEIKLCHFFLSCTLCHFFLVPFFPVPFFPTLTRCMQRVPRGGGGLTRT